MASILIFIHYFNLQQHVVFGLQTIDVTNFSDATNVIMSILMFIGSSPSSVGGGIRTTTFAILILFVINFNNNAEKQL